MLDDLDRVIAREGLQRFEQLLRTVKQLETQESPSGSGGSGGSGVVRMWFPDAPNAVSHPMDDDFDSPDTLPGGAASKWTWLNQGTATLSQAGSGFRLRTSGGAFIRAVEQELPSGAWQATVKGAYVGDGVAGSNAGILLHRIPAGGTNLVAFGFRGLGVSVVRHSSLSNGGSVNSELNEENMGRRGYLRATYDGSQLQFHFSAHGSVWRSMGDSGAVTYLGGAPTHVGLFVQANGAAGPELHCEWFRMGSTGRFLDVALV
jgi:hypothetical protein